MYLSFKAGWHKGLVVDARASFLIDAALTTYYVHTHIMCQCWWNNVFLHFEEIKSQHILMKYHLDTHWKSNISVTSIEKKLFPRWNSKMSFTDTLQCNACISRKISKRIFLFIYFAPFFFSLKSWDSKNKKSYSICISKNLLPIVEKNAKKCTD